MEICGKNALVEGRIVRIGRLDAEGYDFLEDPEAALRAFRSCGKRVDLVTFIQKLSDLTPKYAFPRETDNLASLHVTTHDEWMKHQIDFKARNKARKAAKLGVVIREVPLDDELLHGISAIYNETPIRQGRRFPHYGRDLESLRQMKLTFLDRSIFLGAFLDGSLIGFAKLVTNEDRSQAGLMHILATMQHRDLAPTNALISQAVQSCAERGIAYLWYANFSYGNKQQDSLADFKRHNGFQKVDVPRYYVPLTPMGKLSLKLGMHHRAANWIPEPVAKMYRTLRSRWYTKSFQVAERA